MPDILRGKLPYRYLVVFILFFIWIVVYLQRVNIGILLVDQNFLTDMGIVGESAKQGLLMTLFLVPYALTNIVAAPIGDLLGPRKAILLGLGIAAIAMFIGAWAASFAIILCSRILLGIGQGIHYPTQSIIVKNWFPPAERGKANAIYGAGCIGPLLVLPLFTYLIGHWGWQYILILAGILGILVLLPVFNGMVSDFPHNNRFINKKEQKFLAESAPLGKKLSVKTGGLNDMKPILKSANFWYITIAYSAYLSIWWGIVTWVPQYLMIARGFSLQSLGWVAAIPYGAAALGVAIGGILSDRLAQRSIFGILGMMGAATCIILAAFIPSNGISAALIVSAPLFNTLLYAPIWTIIQSVFPFHLIGTGSGMVNGLSNLVSAAAPVMIGLLIQFSGNYAAGLMYLVIFGLAGAFCSYRLMHQGY